LLGNHHGHSSASDHVADVQDNSSGDNYSGEEAIVDNRKVCGTPEGNCHAAGIHTIVDPTLVPISESSNKRPQTLLSPITNEGALTLPVYPDTGHNNH